MSCQVRNICLLFSGGSIFTLFNNQLTKLSDILDRPTSLLKKILEGVKGGAQTILDISDTINTRVETAKALAGILLNILH